MHKGARRLLSISKVLISEVGLKDVRCAKWRWYQVLKINNTIYEIVRILESALEI